MAFEISASWQPPLVHADPRAPIRADELAALVKYVQRLHSALLAQPLLDVVKDAVSIHASDRYYRVKTVSPLAHSLELLLYVNYPLGSTETWEIKYVNVTTGGSTTTVLSDSSTGWVSIGTLAADESAAYQEVTVRSIVTGVLPAGADVLGVALVPAAAPSYSASGGILSDGATPIDSALYGAGSFAPVHVMRALQETLLAAWRRTGQVLAMALEPRRYIDGGGPHNADVDGATLVARLFTRVPPGVEEITFHARGGNGGITLSVSLDLGQTYQTVDVADGAWASMTLALPTLSDDEALEIWVLADPTLAAGRLESVCAWWEDAVYG